MRSARWLTFASAPTAGRGITAQPAHAEALIAAFDLVARPLLEPTVERRICLVTPKNVEASPAAVSFRAFLGSAWTN
ncbi:TPA: hypothetical protein L5P52_002467 [Pseudomonas aeruginosa]|uniref:LysR substrate-binding domain-containing protein n=1 Tax=Pseudomonas aeruginosa TaxID=287 RepID=UPI0009A7F044|nr:hypothetical protein [Pseudomonas aeruginosa]MBI7325687.1 hypothetical protein [Pseudomonas aeruginosa]MBI7495060.1 hypothetical protein [Pseudomonas aeruginosa]MBI8713350.1 hypothetical protein [Pseudomonas aeruginosa]MCO3531943.1 hypothetical protein [Pseudomonas aeruginosa]